MQATIRLFKALPVETKQGKTDQNILQLTLRKGFLLAPEVIYNYPDPSHILELVDAAYGRSPEQLNQTFHKSWAKVRDASIEQLVLEQIIHYFTTYGFESLGIYDKDSVYIPQEQLNVPELQDGLKLVIIKGYTREELKEKLLKLLRSGVALHEDTIADVLEVATFVGLSADEIATVQNREVKVALYDAANAVPGNPTEFLRYIVYRATNKTLLIKNKALIDQIKGRDNLDMVHYFELYEQAYGLARLAEIFYRFKPIFLAFRTNSKLKENLNRVRRLAKHHHKPMPEDMLNTITARLQHDQPIDIDRLHRELKRVPIFRKIRLAYALKFRTTDASSIMYRIRNGKSYATTFAFTNRNAAEEIYEIVMQSIIHDITQNVAGKKIYIPEGIKYGLPATEKQFTGELPSGTSVTLAEDMVVGIHWENQGEHRIDLDLSLMSAEVGKIGWDRSYRSADKSILFSGDMTDAPSPQGASELFYISTQARGVFILFVNYFNFQSEVEVPFKILVAHEKPVNPQTHYTVDPNKIVALSHTTMKEKQKNLGIIVTEENGCTFYFAESNLGRSISARQKPYTEQARSYLLKYYTDAIVLNDVLVAAGAEMVHDAHEADIDLSPESIDKTTILDLLGKQEESKDAMQYRDTHKD